MAYVVQTVVTKFIFISLIFSLTTPALSLPFVVLNGFFGTCKDTEKIIQKLEKDSGSHGLCITMGDDARCYSVFVPMMEQVKLACKKVKELDELKNGYNLIGISQGSLIGRGLIEFCDEAPPVKNFISVGGPQAGIAMAPNCTIIFEFRLFRAGYGKLLTGITSEVCKWLGILADMLPVYDNTTQSMVAPYNYMKKPKEIDAYLKFCKFLPYANNEIPTEQSPVYKQRFSSLHKLLLVMFEEDSVIVPRESSWFGYYPDGSTDVILPFNETPLYKEDLIGLKTLHEAGKVTFKKAPGDHIHLTDTLYEMITPFLKDDDEDSTKQIAAA